MFDDRKSGGNPGRLIYSGAAEDNQQHFPEKAPEKLFPERKYVVRGYALLTT